MVTYDKHMNSEETVQMIAEYMENGFLENIIDMFRHDPALFSHLPELMADERSRVRIGYVNLVETLMDENREQVLSAVPGMVELLRDERPQIRADAAYMLEIIGDAGAAPALEEAAQNESIEPVREAISDSLDELRKSQQARQ
jgi:hypothetical protein